MSYIVYIIYYYNAILNNHSYFNETIFQDIKKTIEIDSQKLLLVKKERDKK
jgi:hypothetical protein